MKKQKQVTGQCDSCSALATLKEIEIAGKEWKYCPSCIEAYEKEVKVNDKLIELGKTHSYAINRPDIVQMFRDGASVEKVKKFLSMTETPELEAII